MTTTITSGQHTYPTIISEEVKTALSFYPILEKTEITFKFKKNIKKSTMQAQPRWTSLFNSKNNRAYIILISEKIKISDSVYRTKDIPKKVMIGWLGHELGHIMDYRNRNLWDMLSFGYTYMFSEKHMKEAERAADTYAVSHGMGEYILATKNFILDNAEISKVYKDRIRKFYLSPEEIMQLIENLDE